MSGRDRERRRVIEILDTVQQKLLAHRKPVEHDEHSRTHNAMVMWFMGLLDDALEKIVKVSGERWREEEVEEVECGG